MIKIIRARDYDDMSRKAANIISAQVILKPDCVLGLATGTTPIGTYEQLIDWYNKGDVLIEFDRDAITAEGYDITAPILICNSVEFSSIKGKVGNTVGELEQLITARER